MPDSETLEAPQSESKAVEAAKGMPAKASKKNDRDDLGNMFTDFCGNINFKVAIFLFVFGIFIFSDLFIDNVLCKMDGATAADAATSKGTTVQLLILVLFYLCIDLFIQAEII